MKILILGGNGYIGSRLYKHLTSKNYDVTNVDTTWYGKIYDETIVDNFDNLPSSIFISLFISFFEFVEVFIGALFLGSLAVNCELELVPFVVILLELVPFVVIVFCLVNILYFLLAYCYA